MHEVQFMEIVERQIAEQPATLGKLFKVISDKWNDMVEAQSNERESKHLMTIHGMMDTVYFRHIHGKKNPKLFSNAETCSIMDAIDALYPTGFNSNSTSPAVRDVLSLFVESCRALGWKPDDSFIVSTRHFGKQLRMLYDQYDERQQTKG